jgi:uncharacterized protein
MTRRTRAQQRATRRARVAAPALVADYGPQASGKPSNTTTEPPVTARQMLQKALDDTPAKISPSLQLAQTVEVGKIDRTARETQAASHAMDFNGVASDALTFVQATGFPGFPVLCLLAQLPEYRTMHETLADEVIRMWGKPKSSGNAPPARLAKIFEEVERLSIRDAIRTLVIHDQSFGRAHAFFKIRGQETNKELPLVAGPMTVPVNSFLGIRPVEAYWVTPNNYNSIDPSADDFYKPSTWWMLGTEAHATRLRTIISRPVPDMLKPAYSFAGVSMSQLAQPYVDNWLRTRQSVSDTVKQYSVSGVKTDLAQSLTPGANQDLAMRAELINRYRDNRNILFLDMATEEFFQFSTPLSGLDALQAQSQEQQSAVSHIPLIKLLGITPTGLNASSEGEIRVFYDYVRGYQTNVMSSLMNDILAFVQLSLDGQLDPSIKWEWAPLLELTALEMAELQNKNADTDSKYLQEGVISPAQVAEQLNSDSNSRYSGLLANQADMSDLDDADIAGITERILDGGDSPTDQLPTPTLAPAGSQQSDTPNDPAMPDYMAQSQEVPNPAGEPAMTPAQVENPVQAGTPAEQEQHA